MPPYGGGAGDVYEFNLKVYPGAYHEFDRRDRGAHVYLGHWLERHHEAAIDAEQRVQRFSSVTRP